MRALVIDDSKAMRVILGQVLREIGFEVADACDGPHALDELQRTGPFDLALVDWNMPHMTGLEVVRAVRAEARHASMRIMMVTTETELERVLAALEAGADEYVMKPFTKDVLLEKLCLLGIGPGGRA